MPVGARRPRSTPSSVTEAGAGGRRHEGRAGPSSPRPRRVAPASGPHSGDAVPPSPSGERPGRSPRLGGRQTVGTQVNSLPLHLPSERKPGGPGLPALRRAHARPCRGVWKNRQASRALRVDLKTPEGRPCGRDAPGDTGSAPCISPEPPPHPPAPWGGNGKDRLRVTSDLGGGEFCQYKVETRGPPVVRPLVSDARTGWPCGYEPPARRCPATPPHAGAGPRPLPSHGNGRGLTGRAASPGPSEKAVWSHGHSWNGGLRGSAWHEGHVHVPRTQPQDSGDVATRWAERAPQRPRQVPRGAQPQRPLTPRRRQAPEPLRLELSLPWAALPEAQPDFLFSQTATAAGGWGG